MFSQEAVDSGKYNCISKYKVWVSRFIADIGDFMFSLIHPEYSEYGAYSIILEYADIVISRIWRIFHIEIFADIGDIVDCRVFSLRAYSVSFHISGLFPDH